MKLCSMYVLNNCTVSLTQGRYTLRHNSILKHMLTAQKGFIETTNNDLPPLFLVTSADTRPLEVPSQLTSLFLISNPTWFFSFSFLFFSFLFFSFLFFSFLFFSFLFFSFSFLFFSFLFFFFSFLFFSFLFFSFLFFSFLNKKDNTVHLVELTVSFENNIQKAHDCKAQKYSNLVSNILENGFICDLTCFQVKSSQVKLYCSISGNYAQNESSQKNRQEMKRKTNYISMEIVPL